MTIRVREELSNVGICAVFDNSSDPGLDGVDGVLMIIPNDREERRHTVHSAALRLGKKFIYANLDNFVSKLCEGLGFH